jgi:4-azaleucine resistance transporter AzlC
VSSDTPLRAVRREITQTALGIAVASAIYGFSLGALAVTAGLSVGQACAMSLLVFTGATQLAVVSVIDAGGAIGTALANGIMLSLRHIAYGAAMSRVFPRSVGSRLLLSQIIIDESTAMASAQSNRRDAQFAFTVTGVSLFVAWNLATFAGALLSTTVTNPETFGLDAVFPAAFVALLAPQLRRTGAVRAAAMGLVIAAALVPFTPAGIPIIAAAVGVVASTALVWREASR